MTPPLRIRGERQAHLERRSSGLGFDSHLATMLLDDAINRIQPESRPVSDRLGGEKRLENAVSDLRRYSGAIVPNLNQNAVKLGCGPHQHLAASVHSVYRVIDEIGPNLVQLAAARADTRDRALVRT